MDYIRRLTDEIKHAMNRLYDSGGNLTDVIGAFEVVEEHLDIIQCSLSHDLSKEKRMGL